MLERVAFVEAFFLNTTPIFKEEPRSASYKASNKASRRAIEHA